MIVKEAQAWGMDTLERNYQCTKCGKIHRVKIDKTFDLDDGIYYLTYCSRCKEMVRHLDVGANNSEISYYYDVTLDERYY